MSEASASNASFFVPVVISAEVEVLRIALSSGLPWEPAPRAAEAERRDTGEQRYGRCGFRNRRRKRGFVALVIGVVRRGIAADCDAVIAGGQIPKRFHG